MGGGRAGSAVQVRGLRKAFGDRQVLAGIDLEVAAGSVVALLGPNGAGKTTAVQVLTTLIPPDEGSVIVAGYDVISEADAVRASIGVTGQFSAVDKLLTGEENLRLVARLRHLGRATTRRRIAELIERLDLGEAARLPLQAYSGGMRRKLDLAMTLIDRPGILFLDEPTTGLDPRSRASLWQIVREVVAEGTTVFLTTQYLAEADRLADTVVLLNGGRIAVSGTPAELKNTISGGSIELRFADVACLDKATQAAPHAARDEEMLTLTVPSGQGIADVRTLIESLDRAGVEPLGLAIKTPDLDDVFLALTGDQATDKDEAR